MNLQVIDEPVFVLGAPRSGTSMMQWALRDHPNLWGGQESDYLIPLVKALRETHQAGSRRGKLHWLSGQDVSLEEYALHVGYGINSLYTSRSKGLRWVEQTPQYTLHLPAMKLLFPGAKFVFMLRDGRSVVSSLRKFVNPVEHEDACRLWKKFVEAGLSYLDTEGDGDFLVVRYERVVADTEAALHDVFQFLGEADSPKSVDFIKSSAPINSSFAGEASAQKASPRWADWTPEERAIFGEINGDLLRRLKMEPDDAWID